MRFLTHFAHLRPPVVASTGPWIGYLSIPPDTATHEVIWDTSGQSLAVPSGATLNNADVVLSAIAGSEIIATGSLVTSGNFTVGGTARTINVTGATQTGGGTVTLVDPQTVGTWGTKAFIVEQGATLKLGTDWTKQHGWFSGPAPGNGAAQLNSKGTTEIRPADILPGDALSSEPQIGGNTTGAAAATLSFIGNPVGGTTYVRDRAPVTAGGSASSVVNVKGGFYLGVNGFSNTGVVKVESGSALSSSDMDPATVLAGTWSTTVSYQIEGDGVNRAGLPKGALIVRNAQLIEGASITLTGSARISGDVSATTAAVKAPIVASATQTLSIGAPAVSTRFGDAATAIVRFAAANPNLLGPVHVEHGTLELTATNALAQATRVKLTGNAILKASVLTNVKSIQANESTTTIQLSASMVLTAQEAPVVSSNIAGTGTLSIGGGTLLVDRSTLTLTGNINVTTGKFGTTQAVTTITGIFSPGATGTGTLVLTNISGVPSKIVAQTINAPTAGWKVDIPAGLTAGTHTILTRTNGTVVVPVVGVNNSGLTATFAWVAGGNLNMTLA